MKNTLIIIILNLFISFQAFSAYIESGTSNSTITPAGADFQSVPF